MANHLPPATDKPQPDRTMLPVAPLSVAARYRRSQVLGLLLIALVIFAFALLRADRHALFPPGWWRF